VDSGRHRAASFLTGVLNPDTWGMFDKKAQAQALVLDELGYGNVVDTDLHGVDWAHYRYILEVRPEGQAPFRVESKSKVPITSHPTRGDVVTVNYEPKNQKTEIQIEGDERYDPKIRREKRKEEKAARAQALLSGAPGSGLPGTGTVHYHDEPRWTVPAKCPECGARVDQSAAETSEHPRCEYCEKPLPRVRVRTHDLP
jgi:hypothetical protein